ncbi:hypothetical protein Tco_1547366 [Tanacetum coccineum]
MFSLPECLKADSTVRVNQIVTIFLIESSIHLLDQNRYPVDTSLIHLESRKSPTAELFDVDLDVWKDFLHSQAWSGLCPPFQYLQSSN